MGESTQREKVGWTSAQWANIDLAIAEEIDRVCISHKIMPTVKVDRTAKFVSADELDIQNMTLDDQRIIQLAEVSVLVQLDKQQVEEPDLTKAMVLIKRAANELGRLEDEIIISPLPLAGLRVGTRVQRRQANIGLQVLNQPPVFGLGVVPYGDQMVSRVVEGINQLDSYGYVGPYKLVLSNRQFAEVNRPNEDSLVLPRDRIEPFLDEPIYRSSELPAMSGLLLSTGGNPTEKVVAIKPTLRFVEIDADDNYNFNLYTVFALRRKEPMAVVELRFL